jgi:hypothetical protein
MSMAMDKQVKGNSPSLIQCAQPAHAFRWYMSGVSSVDKEEAADVASRASLQQLEPLSTGLSEGRSKHGRNLFSFTGEV